MVYLLHFDQPYKHARHYIGYTDDLNARLERHRAGTGARLLEVIAGAKIGFQLAATWEGDRHLERRLHKRGGSRICPICNPGYQIKQKGE
jgi:predicted GIY-YIG superfamily endonuclease